MAPGSRAGGVASLVFAAVRSLLLTSAVGAASEGTCSGKCAVDEDVLSTLQHTQFPSMAVQEDADLAQLGTRSSLLKASSETLFRLGTATAEQKADWEAHFVREFEKLKAAELWWGSHSEDLSRTSCNQNDCIAECTGSSWSAEAKASQNFGENVQYQKPTFAPSSIDELVQRIGQCTCLVPIGTRHSWGQNVAPGSPECEPVAFEKMRGFTIDSCNKVLTVQAGARFKHVLPELQKRNLSLINYGAIKEQTVVGAIMTSTHGSGQTPSVANSVVELTVVPGGAKKPKVLTPKSDEAAAGWLNTLGGLGFVVEMKLALVPAFNLSVEMSFNHNHAEIQQIFMGQVQRGAEGPAGEYSKFVYASESANYLEKSVVVQEPVTSPYIPTTPMVDPVLKEAADTYLKQKLIGYPASQMVVSSAKMLPLDQTHAGIDFLTGTQHQMCVHLEMELFLEPDHLKEFLDVFQTVLRDCKECRYYHVYMMILRSIMPDNLTIWMSPFQEKPRVSVSLFTYLDISRRPTQRLMPFTSFCSRVLQELVCNKGMDVTYHRGKYVPPEWIGAQELEGNFEDNWNKYQELRDSEDPEGKVFSKYLEIYGDRMKNKHTACPKKS